jgi:hypothetical protein
VAFLLSKTEGQRQTNRQTERETENRAKRAESPRKATTRSNTLDCRRYA